MEMSFNATVYLKNLANAVKQNQVSVKEVDDMVRPLLETKIKLGLFENPYVDEAKVKSTFDNPAHREAVKTVAERSAVLLKNQNSSEQNCLQENRRHRSARRFETEYARLLEFCDGYK